MEHLMNQTEHISLDELDRRSFQAGPVPFNCAAEKISLIPAALAEEPAYPSVLTLDGAWELCAGTDGDSDPGTTDWSAAIAAPVPGSVHTALFQAGSIPDPTISDNQKIAREASYKNWIYRKTFQMTERQQGRYRLEFDGICNRCTVWFNAVCLGRHEGMFGGPEYDVTALIQDENEILVCLDAIPFDSDGAKYAENNHSWNKTVVINNVYGWHYSNMPSLGIWRSVRLVRIPEVELRHPFVMTQSLDPAILQLQVKLSGPAGGWSGKISLTVHPDNFTSPSHTFDCLLTSAESEKIWTAQWQQPDARIWWPVDLGEPSLYQLSLCFTADDPRDRQTATSVCQTVFGIRTIEMASLPDGPRPDLYDWTFIINGHKTFVKGTGWCTADAMLDFSRERLERFISLARDQHCQMLRAWGSGMPETDEFYDLCNRYGIMVLQEWPTAWNSHRTQPLELLEDTVARNTLRLRNHPALVMWGGGNESSEPFGEAIDMMGRLAVELDGTRPFHRGEPWGGSSHNYTCYWGYQPLDFNLNLTSRFFGEFGLACLPAEESVNRYLSDNDRKIWPPEDNISLRYHTPIFGHADDLSRILQYARYFVPEQARLGEIITGSQLSQAEGVRHTLERARTRWPDCSGALYYKLNDNFPAASWSTVDWYGAPKIGHYLIQDAFTPLHACVLFQTTRPYGSRQDWPVFLLDDASALADHAWSVSVRVRDGSLKLVAEKEFAGIGSIASPLAVGSVTLTADQTRSVPLLVTVEVRVDGTLADRTFYFLNYEQAAGCLFRLPRTSLAWTIDHISGHIAVSNRSDSVPAVAVRISKSGCLDQMRLSDNYFWLEPGETHMVLSSILDGIEVDAWNAI